MEFVEVPGDEHAVGVAPWTGADAGACINGLAAVGRIVIGAEIRTPCVSSGAGGGCQLLAQRVGAAQAAQISRRAPRAADEERHRPTGVRRDDTLVGATPDEEGGERDR